MKPTRRTQPMRKGGARLQTRGLAAAMTGGKLTGGTRAPAPNTHPVKPPVSPRATGGPAASPMPRRVGGGGSLKPGRLGQKLRGAAPKRGKVGELAGKALTNRTGNARDGQKYRETIDAKGREVHVYAGGRRVVDATPDGVDRKRSKAGLGGPAASTNPPRSFQPVKATGGARAVRKRKRGLVRKLGY